MDFPDHYTSHKYKNLYWTSFEKLINDEQPSPECYQEKYKPDIDIDEEEDNTDEQNTHESQPQTFHEEMSTKENDSEQIIIEKQPDGKIIAKTDQVLDYQQRPLELDNICLWHFIAQSNKIRKPLEKKKKQRMQCRRK